MDERPTRQTGTHVFNVVVLLVAAAALAWTAERFGVANLGRLWASFGGGTFTLMLVLALAGSMADASALHALMKPEARTVSFARVWAAQLSGAAVNALTPGGKLGEATKITLLVGHAPRDRVVSAVVLFNLCYLYTAAAIVVIGVPATELLVALPPHLAVTLWIATGVVVALGIGLAFVVKHGATGLATKAATRLRLLSEKRRDRVMAALGAIDRRLRELGQLRLPSTREGFAWVATARAIGWIETVVLLHALGARITIAALIALISSGVLIDALAGLIPLGLGVSEGGGWLIFALLGLAPTAGVAIAMIKRARKVVMAFVGLAVMAGLHTANRVALARRHARWQRAARDGLEDVSLRKKRETLHP